MLCLTVAAIVMGSCVVDSADILTVTCTSDETPKVAVMFANEVTPARRGRLGWAINYKTVIAQFPNLDFNKELTKQLTVTFKEKPLHNLTVAVNMWSGSTTHLDPSDIVGAYTDTTLYHNPTRDIKESKFYFEADKE